MKPYIRALLGLIAFGLLCVALGLTLPSGSYTAKAPTQDVVLQDAHDGDTPYLFIDGAEKAVKCRMYGIDCPETELKGRWPEQDFAIAAKQYFLKRAYGKKLKAKFHGDGGYNRPLVQLFDGDLDIGRDMVDAGLAWATPKYSKAYVADQAEARKRRAGLWCCDPSPIEPSEWRRGVRATSRPPVLDDD